MKILIQNGRVIDPATGRDERADANHVSGESDAPDWSDPAGATPSRAAAGNKLLCRAKAKKKRRSSQSITRLMRLGGLQKCKRKIGQLPSSSAKCNDACFCPRPREPGLSRAETC